MRFQKNDTTIEWSERGRLPCKGNSYGRLHADPSISAQKSTFRKILSISQHFSSGGAALREDALHYRDPHSLRFFDGGGGRSYRTRTYPD